MRIFYAFAAGGIFGAAVHHKPVMDDRNAEVRVAGGDVVVALLCIHDVFLEWL